MSLVNLKIVVNMINICICIFFYGVLCVGYEVHINIILVVVTFIIE